MSTNYIAPIWRMPENANNTPVDKLSNYSIDFQSGGSSGRHIDCGTDLFTDSTIPSISISAWINTSAAGVIMSKDLGVNPTRNFLFQIAGSLLYWQTSTDGNTFDSLTVSSSLVLNDWHHVVVTYNAGTSSGDGEKKIYIDGSEVADSPLATYGEIYNTLTTPINIGRRGDNARYFYDNMSQVCIFDYALSSSQVSYLYGLDNPMAITGGEPVAYWPLGDNSNPNAPGSFPNISVGADSVFAFVTADALRITDSAIVPERFQNIGNNNSYSISFWMKSTYTGSGGGAWYANHTFTEIRTQTNSQTHVPFSIGMSSNTIRFGRADNHTSSFNAYNSSANNLSDGQWHHVVCAINDDTLKMYIDGSLDSTRTFTNATGDCSVGDGTIFPTQNFQIGARTQNGGAMDGFANGDELTNFQYWDTELLADDVTTLYNNGQPLMTGTQPQESNLIGWYKMNQSANWEAITANTWQIPDNRSAYPQSFGFTKTSGEYIDLGTDDWFNDYNNEITFSVWVNKPNWSSTGFEGLISKYGVSGSTIQYRIAYPSSANQLQFYLQGGPSGGPYSARINTVTLTSAQTDPDWLHILWRHSASTSTSQVIFNGDHANAVSLTNIAANPYAQPQITTTNMIGNVSNGLQPFDGAISNYQRFNSYLDNATVEALYNDGIPSTTAITNSQAWYKLDNTATFSTNWSIPDASGNANTATSSGLTEQSLVNNNVSVLNAQSQSMATTSLVQSNLTRTQPYSNYSFNFDSASSDYFDLGGLQGTALQPSNTTLVSDGFSVSVWVNVDDNSTFRTFWQNDGLGNANYYGLIFLMNGPATGIPAGRINIGYSNGGTAGTASRKNYITTDAQITSTGTWYHLVAIYKGIAVTPGLYVNGVEITSFGSSGTATTLAYSSSAKGSIGIGRNAIQPMEGEISNCACFNRTLTQDEVLKIYNNGVPQDLQTASSFSNNLVAWWPMDGSNSYYDGTNWVVRDLENGKDGTGVNTSNVDDLVGNAPGSQASGVGSNFVVGYLEGNMKDSDKNAYSINMGDYADGVTNPADSGRSTDTP